MPGSHLREQRAGAAGPVDRYGHRMSEQAQLGLLAYLGAHTLDEDYAFVSQQREARRTLVDAPTDESTPSGRRRRIGPVGAVVIAVFAVLSVTAGLQTSRNGVSDEQQRSDLVGQVTAARKQLDAERARLAGLQRETARLRGAGLSGSASAQRLLARSTQLGVLAGTVPVRGPGVRVVADDAPNAGSPREMVLDSDLQRLVNGLWAAGAEAVALNGQRLTTLSTIRLAGSAITVNNHSLRRPYVVTAIGDKDTLPARFAETSSGQAWLDLKQEVGLRLSITPQSSLRLPATEVTGLRYANRKAGGPS